MGLFTYKFTLGEGSALDSVKQHMKLIVDGVEVETKTRVLKPVPESPLMEFTDRVEGVPVRFELRDEDDAGLLSVEPRVFEHTPVDTTPPPTSGEVTVEVVEQDPAAPPA